MSPRSTRPPVALLLLVPFFCSGAAALVAQLCWLRILTVTLGGSSTALNVILITFMGGLALGAALAKRVCRRTRNYVLLYAALEGILSVYLLASPWVLRVIGRGFIQILPQLGHETLLENLVRLVAAGSTFILPTVVMGMTTPILITATVRRFRETGSYAGMLYGINTLGAAVGALLAGCYLILAIGVTQSLLVASGLNLLAALLALGIVRLMPREDAQPLEEEPTADTPPTAEQDRRAIRGLCLLAFVGGFGGMALEVILARLLLFVIGGSYYSHTISIGGFLLGIVAGSLVIGLLARRWPPTSHVTPLLFVFFGLATLASGLLFERLPMALTRIVYEYDLLDVHFLTLKLVATLLLVLLPAMASGMILPFLIHLLTQRTRDVTRAASSALFYNTIGSVLGVALTGYVFIELVGVRNALFGVAVLSFIMALYAVRLVSEPTGRVEALSTGLGLAGLVGALALVVVRGGTPLVVHSVIYEQLGRPDVLFYEEDESASVTAVDFRKNSRGLMINGLLAGRVEPQRIVHGVISDVAMMSHPDPQTMFIAGVGTGRTAGVAGLYSSVAIEAVEISAAVIDALPYLDPYTFNASRNPAVEIMLGDARHFLQTTSKRYDLIVPDVYISALTGTAYLYNREFFELCAQRLNPGGRVLLNIYLNTDIDQVIATSFYTAFRYVQVVTIPYSEYTFLIGANEPIEFPEQPWDRWAASSEVMRRCDKLGLLEGDGLGSFIVADKTELSERLAGVRASTDDHPIVDFIRVTTEAPLSW